MNLPSVMQLMGSWEQQLGTVKGAWGSLCHDERLIKQGRAQRLAGLLQARYAFSRDEAKAQVQRVLGKRNG